MSWTEGRLREDPLSVACALSIMFVDKQHIDAHIDPVLGHLMVDELTQQHVQHLIRKKADDGLRERAGRANTYPW